MTNDELKGWLALTAGCAIVPVGTVVGVGVTDGWWPAAGVMALIWIAVPAVVAAIVELIVWGLERI